MEKDLISVMLDEILRPIYSHRAFYNEGDDNYFYCSICGAEIENPYETGYCCEQCVENSNNDF